MEGTIPPEVRRARSRTVQEACSSWVLLVGEKIGCELSRILPNTPRILHAVDRSWKKGSQHGAYSNTTDRSWRGRTERVYGKTAGWASNMCWIGFADPSGRFNFCGRIMHKTFTCDETLRPVKVRHLTTYVPGVSRTLPEMKERMGSLCEVGMEVERAMGSPMFCGWAGGGLRAPAVGVERSPSLELTDRLLLQEKPEVEEAIVSMN